MSDQQTSFSPSTDPQIVLSYLQPMLDDIKLAFDAAIPAAHTFFTSEGEPVERTLFAAIVRWHVKRALRSYGVSEESAERAIEYELDDVSNIGLIINCDGFQIRILKARDSKVPVSGSSLRQEFYQHNLLYEAGEMLDLGPSVLNLVVLWETDYVSTAALSVACPKCEVEGASEGRRKVECYWQQPITAPVVALPDLAGVDRLEVVDSDLDEVTLLDDQAGGIESGEQPRRARRAAAAGSSSSGKSNDEEQE